MDDDLPNFRAIEEHRLRREDFRNIAGADPDGDAAERSVRAGVTVPAHDRHAGLSQSLFRSDDMHDALTIIFQIKQRHTKISTVFFDGGHHLFGQIV